MTLTESPEFIRDVRGEDDKIIFRHRAIIRDYDPFFAVRVGAAFKKLHLIDDGIIGVNHPFVEHRGSDMIYPFDFYTCDPQTGKPKDRVMVQFAAAGAVSSTHKHEEPIFEEYYPVDFGERSGVLYLNIGGNIKAVPTTGFRVPTDMYHRAFTREEGNPVVTIVVLRNAGSIPEHRHHTYISKNGNMLF